MDSLDRLERLFRSALLHSPEDRSAFLDAACVGDENLRRELDDLLEADLRAESRGFLEDPPGEPALLSDSNDPRDDAETGEFIGRRIGPYHLERLLGRGGMGEVYLAVREQPFRQYVALKIIRRGMDSPDVVRRFSGERQILAALNHPNISRLLDGGVTLEQRPYFVMEYVGGKPITDYCDAHRLSIRERLELFSTVCEAVQYAHQNLIIHRDLKPSNILVSDAGKIKLLDFGIAKILNPHLGPMPMPITRTELRMLTPEYASPEQVRGEALSTSTDVYSLGVILYELLTGHRPYHVAGLPTHDVISVVCGREPERPSVQVAARGTATRSDGNEDSFTPSAVCEARGVPMDRLRRLLRGDLDNITLMALRKEPSRRYPSAEGLAADVERYLSGLPVVARPNTYGYRVRKFVVRHRTGVVAFILILLSLVGGLGAALWQAAEARQARARAEETLGRSEAVTGFLTALFQASDPRETAGVDVTARELLERGTERAEALREQPELQAHLLDVVGRVYESLGQYEEAENLLSQALDLRRRSLGERSLPTAESMTSLATVLTHRGRYQEAESLLTTAVAIEDQLLEEGDPRRVRTLQQIGYLLPFMGKWREAEEARRNILDLHRASIGNDHPLVANSMIVLGRVLRAEGRYDEAESLFREALAMHIRTQGEESLDVANSMFQLAILLDERESYDEAESLLRRAIDVRGSLKGETDPEVSSYLFELGEVIYAKGRAEEAENLLRDALAARQRLLGDHPTTGDGLVFLASFLYERGVLHEADSLFRAALALRRRLLGEEHLEVAVVLRHLGRLQTARERYREADSLLRAAHAMHIRVNGPDHHHVAATLSELAQLREQVGDREEAASLYLDAIRILRKSHSDEHVQVQGVLSNLIRILEELGRSEEAHLYRTLQVDTPVGL